MLLALVDLQQVSASHPPANPSTRTGIFVWYHVKSYMQLMQAEDDEEEGAPGSPCGQSCLHAQVCCPQNP